MTTSSNSHSFKKIRSTEFLLLCGVIGPLLFILVFLIEGATRPGYSAWRTDVSYLALSNQGWEQIANFIVCGSLCIAFAVGLRRIWRTGRASGWVHGINGAVFFLVVLPAACFVLAWRFAADPQNRRWATYSWMTGALILLISVISIIALPFAEYAGVPVLDGLLQRVQIILGWVWLALTALRLFLQERKARSYEASTRIAVTNAKAD
jgi:uncharacterized membrane protein